MPKKSGPRRFQSSSFGQRHLKVGSSVKAETKSCVTRSSSLAGSYCLAIPAMDGQEIVVGGEGEIIEKNTLHLTTPDLGGERDN